MIGERMRLPDAMRSAAILIGSARYTHTQLEDLPAAAANIAALESALTDRESGGLHPKHCHPLINPDHPHRLARTVAEIARATEDTLVVYYAGHGLLDERGELFFGLRNSDPEFVAYSSLEFALLRRALRDSPAANRVLILDCCFSGRAIEAMSDPRSMVGGQMDIRGVYTLTSTSATRPAHAPAGAEHTAFTGELLDLLRHGIPDGPELLTFGEIYPRLLDGMRALDLPLPQQRGTNTVEYLALTRNPACPRVPSGERNATSAPEPPRHGPAPVLPMPGEQPVVGGIERVQRGATSDTTVDTVPAASVADDRLTHAGTPAVQGTAEELRLRAQRGELAAELAAALRVDYSTPQDCGELGAWKQSLPELLELLHHAGLGHIQVLLEHHLPYSPKRIDAILCGQNPDTRDPSYVLIELKRWSHVSSAGDGLVKTSGLREPQLHPVEQVRAYCQHLLDFTPSLARRPDTVRGVAYLHNCQRRTGWNLDDVRRDDYGRLYALDEANDLIEDLRSLLDPDPSSAEAAANAAGSLLTAATAPAKTLLRTAADAFEERDDFVLLDEQKAAFFKIWNAVTALGPRNRRTSGTHKEVFIVLGGPGSGKSAIATSLLSKLARQDSKVLHATGSKAFTETMRDRVARGSDRISRLFTYFNQFDNSRHEALDVLICDESHRIRGASGRGTPRAQIDQLIAAAKVPVFLLDEHQVVRPGENGTLHNIEQAVRAAGCLPSITRLEGQFRCGGSPHYDQWVLRLLGLTAGEPTRWSDFVADTDDEYVVASAESPHALEKWLDRQSHMMGGTARIAAGFCWPWSDPAHRDGTQRLVDDIHINGWRRPWNAKSGKEVSDTPPSSLWASDPRGFGQVGCIYTAQGFEYDWAGVIFGPDLVIRDGRWHPQPENSHDNSVTRRTSAETFLRLVRNTYKVLLTRGMQGVCVYSTDPETNAYLQHYAR